MGLLDLFKRTAPGQTTPLSTAQVDSNWQKIMDLFPTPANGNTDVGKALTLNSAKTGFDFTAFPNGSGGNTLQFPADPSLDISLHKNRLVMNDGGVAKLANLSGGTAGQKGKFRITTYSLPQYPVGAIYEFDFMGVNFNDGDEIVIPITESNKQVIQYTVATAKTVPTGSGYFAIGVDLQASLVGLLQVLQGHVIGAWAVSIDGTKIVFRNNHILTGINGSTSYALPTEYNGIEAMFIRRDISLFNGQVTYSVDGGFTQASFSDEYGGNNNFPLGVINVDGYYPFQLGNGYFIGPTGNLAYYNGSTYEGITSTFRDEGGDLFFASPAFSGNNNGANLIGGFFNAWTPTFSANLGTNYNITQTRQGIDGIVQSLVDVILEQGGQGMMIWLNDGNCNQRLAIHALGMMGDFTSIGIAIGEYSGFSIPTTNLELSKLLKYNFLQNPSTFFAVTADGHSNNESWIEIEELSIQTEGNCNPQLISWDEGTQGSNPFSTWFSTSQLTAPTVGSLPVLNKPVLGFLQDIVNGVALISDNNVNQAVIEDIAGNELTQQQLDDIETDPLYAYYILGTDGRMKKLLSYGNNVNQSFISPIIVLGGGVFLCLEVAGRGGTALFRRVAIWRESL